MGAAAEILLPVTRYRLPLCLGQESKKFIKLSCIEIKKNKKYTKNMPP